MYKLVKRLLNKKKTMKFYAIVGVAAIILMYLLFKTIVFAIGLAITVAILYCLYIVYKKITGKITTY